MEVGFWRRLAAEGAPPLKQRIPEVALFRGETLEAWYFSDPLDALRQRAATAVSRRALLDRLMALAALACGAADFCGRTPAAIVRCPAACSVGGGEEARGPDAESPPSRATIFTVSQLRRLLEQPQAGQRPLNGAPCAGEWSLQSLVKVAAVPCVAMVVDYSCSVLGEEHVAVGDRSWDGGEDVAEADVPAPESQSAMARPMMSRLVHYVDWLHGRYLQRLRAEFVVDSRGQLVLHTFLKASFFEEGYPRFPPQGLADFVPPPPPVIFTAPVAPAGPGAGDRHPPSSSRASVEVAPSSASAGHGAGEAALSPTASRRHSEPPRLDGIAPAGPREEPTALQRARLALAGGCREGAAAAQHAEEAVARAEESTRSMEVQGGSFLVPALAAKASLLRAELCGDAPPAPSLYSPAGALEARGNELAVAPAPQRPDSPQYVRLLPGWLAAGARQASRSARPPSPGPAPPDIAAGGQAVAALGGRRRGVSFGPPLGRRASTEFGDVEVPAALSRPPRRPPLAPTESARSSSRDAACGLRRRPGSGEDPIPDVGAEPDRAMPRRPLSARSSRPPTLAEALGLAPAAPAAAPAPVPAPAPEAKRTPTLGHAGERLLEWTCTPGEWGGRAAVRRSTSGGPGLRPGSAGSVRSSRPGSARPGSAQPGSAPRTARG